VDRHGDRERREVRPGPDDVLGDDIAGFCAALAGGEGARSYRDRWREQLNRNVARKLGRLGD